MGNTWWCSAEDYSGLCIQQSLISGGSRGRIWDARDWIWVRHVQDKCPNHYTITLASIQMFFWFYICPLNTTEFWSWPWSYFLPSSFSVQFSVSKQTQEMFYYHLLYVYCQETKFLSSSIQSSFWIFLSFPLLTLLLSSILDLSHLPMLSENMFIFLILMWKSLKIKLFIAKDMISVAISCM